MTLAEGWYLMSTRELEIELARFRSPDAETHPSGAVRVSVEEALAYRDAGNLPDEQGRTLRLVLHVRDETELASLDAKRLAYEPDFHAAPKWRRRDSKPVNVVPLRHRGVGPVTRDPWWEDDDVGALEREWASTGTVAGLVVPAAYRGFVFKTVIALRRAGLEVTPTSVADSVERWLPPDEAARIRAALLDGDD
jgi:hypothetical protein